MNDPLSTILEKAKHEFRSTDELAPLIDVLKNKKVVMLGESSHGTHEYYHWRARISKVLMEEHGFDFVAVEGDWPPCYELNRHVKSYPDTTPDTYEVLQEFKRWPSWMWANYEIHEWAKWLKQYNQDVSADKRKGFYGLDIYSLYESMDAIMDYLKKEDPSAMQTAQDVMRCFEPYRDGDDAQRYAQSTQMIPEGCRREVIEMLAEIRRKSPSYNTDREEAFSTQQNALIARNSEEYYREMVGGGRSIWNLRDRHMMDTLERLLGFHGENSKGIVWAHNTHIGDARYTDMAEGGLFNIGQLAREVYGEEEVSLVGFGSHRGTVLAGERWGAPAKEMKLPGGIPGSWEEICNAAGEQFFLFSESLLEHPEFLDAWPHRAVGVVYHPAQERFGNYVPSIMQKRYDAFVFFNKTLALHAIPIGEVDKVLPDTYPFGI